MEERHVSFAELSRRIDVHEQTLRSMARHSLSRIDFDVLGRICSDLTIEISDLLVLEPDDIWAPILTRGEVTIHYGSRTLTAAPGKNGQPSIPLQYIGKWDDEASRCVSEYLYQRGHVRITYADYMSGDNAMAASGLATMTRNILREGNHIVLGSPLANTLVEYVMCAMYGVAPFDQASFTRFPYAFEWRPDRQARSAFGRAVETVPGIRCNRSNRLVAKQSIVDSGRGDDCGIICVHRGVSIKRFAKRVEQEERVIAVLMGHGGPGTLAAAQLATSPRTAPEFYPETIDSPYSRAFQVTYERPPSPHPIDNRVIVHNDLIPPPDDDDPPTS